MTFKPTQAPALVSTIEETIFSSQPLLPEPVLLRRMRLTERECETLKYIAAGHTSEDIALNLYLSKDTVDTHRKNIIRKLGVTNVTAAVAFALRNGLIS